MPVFDEESDRVAAPAGRREEVPTETVEDARDGNHRLAPGGAHGVRGGRVEGFSVRRTVPVHVREQKNGIIAWGSFRRQGCGVELIWKRPWQQKGWKEAEGRVAHVVMAASWPGHDVPRAARRPQVSVFGVGEMSKHRSPRRKKRRKQIRAKEMKDQRGKSEGTAELPERGWSAVARDACSWTVSRSIPGATNCCARGPWWSVAGSVNPHAGRLESLSKAEYEVEERTEEERERLSWIYAKQDPLQTLDPDKVRYVKSRPKVRRPAEETWGSRGLAERRRKTEGREG